MLFCLVFLEYQSIKGIDFPPRPPAPALPPLSSQGGCAVVVVGVIEGVLLPWLLVLLCCSAAAADDDVVVPRVTVRERVNGGGIWKVEEKEWKGGMRAAFRPRSASRTRQ